MSERARWFRSAPAGFAAGIVVIFAPVLATTSLDDVRCDHENPRVESHHSLGHEFFPRLSRIRVSGPAGERTVVLRGYERCVEDRGLKLCMHAGYDDLTLEAFNESEDVAQVLWSRGAFVDENGVRRRLDSESGGSYRPTLEFPDRDGVISVGNRTIERAWPEGKVYYSITGCKDAWIFRESLVPARLTGSEAGDRAIIERVSRERIPVAFEFPVRHGGEESLYRIEIIIVTFDEWARGPEVSIETQADAESAEGTE